MGGLLGASSPRPRPPAAPGIWLGLEDRIPGFPPGGGGGEPWPL